MITGFNTDIEHDGVIYHVQTEDKGTKNPMIESLVYVKGAILDAIRTRYDLLLNSSDFSEARLQRILEFQHKQIITSIKRGTYKKGMWLESFVDGSFSFEFGTKPAAVEAPSADEVVERPSLEPRASLPTSELQTQDPASDLTSQQPPHPVQVLNPAQPSAVITPAPEKMKQGDTSRSESREALREVTVDSVDVTALIGQRGIEICVESSKEFRGGDHVDLTLYVQDRQNHVRMENVQIIIKIIGSAFSPRFYAGKTNKTGSLRMSFILPTFSAGSAALIIQASAAVGADEVKYLIRKKA